MGVIKTGLGRTAENTLQLCFLSPSTELVRLLAIFFCTPVPFIFSIRCITGLGEERLLRCLSVCGAEGVGAAMVDRQRLGGGGRSV